MKRLLFLILLCLPKTLRAAGIGDFHALIISADDSYVKNESQLNYATLDAERMLRAIRTVGQVSNTNIDILNNPSVSQVAEVAKRLGEKSLKKFLFYFSGHSDEEGLHFKDGQVSRLRFHQMLKAIPAQTKIVILDSCFSGALKSKGIKASKPIDLVQYDVDEPTGSVILTSSSQSEFSYESEKLRGSIFTYHLISGLYGQADGNGDGVVTISELYQYVYAQTKYQSLVSGGVTQHPEFESSLSGRGALVVSFPAKTNGRFELAPELSGELTLASVNGMNFFKFYKDRGESRLISVPAGGYLLNLDDNHQSGVSEARLAANETVALKKSNFKWHDSKEVSPVKSKGAEPVADANPFIFGVSLGRHSSFEEVLDPGPLIELSVLSPSLGLLWGRWRLSSHLGHQSHELIVSDLNKKFEFNRFSLGFEGDYPGFSLWHQQWLVGFRVGRLTPVDTTRFEQQSFAHLTLGMRFRPGGWPLNWGLEFSSEGYRTEAGEKKEATSASVVISF